jgi:hypothetical protein
MRLDWTQFVGKSLNITMLENYGVVYSKENVEQPVFYEIVFKTGVLAGSYDDGLLLEAAREEQKYKVFVPYSSIKCVEIF